MSSPLTGDRATFGCSESGELFRLDDAELEFERDFRADDECDPLFKLSFDSADDDDDDDDEFEADEPGLDSSFSI